MSSEKKTKTYPTVKTYLTVKIKTYPTVKAVPKSNRKNSRIEAK
jgi:hypothetical protein